MMDVGSKMIAAHPLTGVGPDMVSREYEKYRPDYGVNKTNPHLHDVPLQDRGGARAASAGGVALVHGGVDGRDLPSLSTADTRTLSAAAAGGDRRDARRRLLRIQLWRLEFLMMFSCS
jgi:hypothetical protein